MTEICKFNACTGCKACEMVCPKHAISFLEDKKGFLRPVINQNACIECRACTRACVIHEHHKIENKGQVYAAWCKNKAKRNQSTSGGIFRLIAEVVLRENGVVYGAAFEAGMVVKHKRVVDESELPLLLGSKYVQSDVNESYFMVKTDLESGKTVLFSGVPCQIAGLKNYLKKEYANLVCVDILCHGVSSPIVFRDYLHYLEGKYDSKVNKINFRYKKPGWTVFSMKVDFESGKSYLKSKFRDPFLCFFLSDLILRPSCHECRFTSPERMGDITLGDFWKYIADTKNKKGIERGVNLVIVNSDTGRRWFDRIKTEIFWEQNTWDNALSSNRNFMEPWKKPEKSDLFWNDYDKVNFEELVKKYCDELGEGEFTSRRRAWLNAHRYIFSEDFTNWLKRVIHFN